MDHMDIRTRDEKQMNVTHLITNVSKHVRSNSTTILAAIGVSGTISTAYLAGKAGYESRPVLDNLERDEGVELTFKEKLEAVWKMYIPAGASAGATVGCIVAATRIGNRKTAVATAVYTLSEKAFHEYKDKVVEVHGEKKEQAIRDDIAKDHMADNLPPSTEVLITGPGNVLCLERHTGRYFTSDIETIRRAVNDINAMIITDYYVCLDDFYHLLGLSPTGDSGDIGWDSNQMLELQFTSLLTEDNRPCLAFAYNYIKPI